MINFNCLPEDILLHIFKHLYLSDVLKIALTSRRFNSIVNQNFNVLAPSKHKIKLNCWNEYREWIGMRKYSSFVIDSTAIARFEQIISTKSHQITKLSLNFHNDPYIDMEVVRELLIECENIKELRLNLTNVIINNENSLENLPILKNLESLDFYGQTKYFNLFTNFQFKTLKLRFYDPKDCLEIYKNFLKKQNNLTELKIFGYNTPSTSPRSLFDDEKLEKVKFRLKKFKISRHPSFFVETESFHKFLLNHRESLTKFSISHSEVNLDTVQNFQKLKKLKVERSFVLMRYTNPNIEHVKVKKSSIGFVENLHNLKILTIMESVSFLNELNLTRFKKLETLDIYASHIPRLVIPSVKNLKLANAISFDANILPIFQNKIQNISLQNCENVRAILDFLNRPEMRLKTLIIEDSQIETKCLNAIKRNQTKIEVLEMKRCRRIANIPLWSYYLGADNYLDKLRMGEY